MKERKDKKITRCECLDFVEVCHRRRVYPLMYCHMELEGHIDIERLKQAVTLSGNIVPEILFSYDFQKGYFINLGHTAEDVVRADTAEPFGYMRPDLSRQPQLQIILTTKGEMEQVVIIMSHILSDGNGFLQYLYLLAALYNGEQVWENLRNKRSIAPYLKNIHILPPTEQTKHDQHRSVPPLRLLENGSHFLCLTCRISEETMARIHEKAKRSRVTMNDIFMTAYARVIARLKNTDRVLIPCPADLRKFCPKPDVLTVANMTGVYGKVAVEIPPGSPFSATLLQVHIEMLLQKSRCRCFAGIKPLNRIFHRAPHILLEQAIKAVYQLLPVAYTNFGRIDQEKLFLKDCVIRTCFLTGTYRIAPDFQLAVSTFKNVCTLNCALLGTAEEAKTGEYILNQVKQEILGWLADP